MDLLEQVTLDDLSGEALELAELVGLETFKALVTTYSGMMVYIPSVDTITRKVRDKLICNMILEHDVRTVCRKFGLTESRVREITSGVRETIRNAPCDGQGSLFDI